MPRLPSLERFYRNGLLPVPVSEIPDDKCGICLDEFSTLNVVKLKPCKHMFHRMCIVGWFRHQLVDESGNRRAHNHGSCPLCRINLFDASLEISVPHINALTWVQSLYDLRGTEFDEVAESALNLIRRWGLNRYSLSTFVDRMIAQNDEYRQVAIDLGVCSPSRPHVRLATHRYQVDVDTEEDLLFVDQALLGDSKSLSITFIQLTPLAGFAALTMAECIALIDTIRLAWYENGYPRTNYVTLESLHNLIICAGIINLISNDPRGRNSVAFGHMLAHGDRLLLEAQERMRSGNLDERELREHRRILNWSRDRRPSAGNRGDKNWQMIWWVASFRMRTRGGDPSNPTEVSE